MPFLRRLSLCFLLVALGATDVARAADVPNPRPAARLPFLRRYVKPAGAPATTVDRSPASSRKSKVKITANKGKGKKAPPRATAKAAPGKKGRGASARVVRGRPVKGGKPAPKVVARPAPRPAAPRIVARPAPLPVNPAAPSPATPAAVANLPPPPPGAKVVRQPARIPEAPSAYSASPDYNPNMTTSTSILPFHPSTPGRKPPAKTIFLDMTRKY